MRYRLATCLIGLVLVAQLQITAQRDFIWTRFEQYIEALRRQSGIPGLSAAIVDEGHIVWERGFGYQDVERAIAAAPDTPYHVGDLTGMLTATLVLQCVEQGTLSLDDPVRNFVPSAIEAGVNVRHVLSHTSEGRPGATFKYSPTRYAALTSVVEGCTGRGYRDALARSILERLAMTDSVPGADLASPSAADLFEPETVERYARVVRRLAKPYKVDKKGKATASAYPSTPIDAATGLISTVRDLARFDAALDEGVLLRPETLTRAWTNVMATDGVALPHGLGWFVRAFNDDRIVWHFGLVGDSYSALYLKVPGRRLTMILLANSDGLSAPFSLASGDMTSSLFARLFLGFVL